MLERFSYCVLSLGYITFSVSLSPNSIFLICTCTVYHKRTVKTWCVCTNVDHFYSGRGDTGSPVSKVHWLNYISFFKLVVWADARGPLLTDRVAIAPLYIFWDNVTLTNTCLKTNCEVLLYISCYIFSD